MEKKKWFKESPIKFKPEFLVKALKKINKKKIPFLVTSIMLINFCKISIENSRMQNSLSIQSKNNFFHFNLSMYEKKKIHTTIFRKLTFTKFDPSFLYFKILIETLYYKGNKILSSYANLKKKTDFQKTISEKLIPTVYM